MSSEKIISDWKKKNFKPLYWLEGEEEYYINLVMDYAEHHILSDSEAEFNRTVFYGKDANWSEVVNACRRYPMFADKQVVLLKEAQQMRDLDKLESYFENPLPSTIFVVSHKEKTLDKRKTLYKTIKKEGEIFTSEKLREYKLPEWIGEYIQSKGFTISQKGIMLLAEHIGNDLSRISNEVDKIAVNLDQRKNITEDDIEKFVGVSKEFNAFELQDAISKKDFPRAMQIIHYFEGNPKAAPIQLVLPALYGYFSKLYVLFGMADKSEAAVKPLFYNNPFAAKQAIEAAKLYSYNGVEKALLLLHEYNLRSVGVNDIGTPDASLMKEMVVKMMS
jgi:DNA polymerase-3 subunit delta